MHQKQKKTSDCQLLTYCICLHGKTWIYVLTWHIADSSLIPGNAYNISNTARSDPECRALLGEDSKAILLWGVSFFQDI